MIRFSFACSSRRRRSTSSLSPPPPSDPLSPPSLPSLQPQLAIYGSFSAPKQHEIVVVRASTSLEILRPDPATGRLRSLASADAFGNIRSIAPFRLPGSSRDVILVGSDSGRLVILEFDPRRRAFVKVHQETFGKSGVRRVVPGQFVAADPRGRAAVVAAVERAKLIYVLNRETAAVAASAGAAPGASAPSSSSSSHLTISSPLEANKSRAITFAVAGLDVGFDNPVFAAIELDYSGADEDPTGEAAATASKALSLYRLDLGLNHVSRISSLPVDNGANLLLAVPGGGDGPGGVLICCENFLIYRSCAAAVELGSSEASAAAAGAEELRVPLPRRRGLPSHRGTLVVAAAAHKQKSMFFFLLQSEYGDLFKVTLEAGGGGGAAAAAATDKVTDVVVRYFDTIPPSNALCVLRTGFLFSAAEGGDHGLFQFSGLGDDADAAEARASETAPGGSGAGMVPPLFEPRREPRNLVLVDELDSTAPLLDLKLAAPVLLRSVRGSPASSLQQQHAITPAAAAAAFYAACGRGPRSTLRLLRPGAALAEVASSPLPGAPTGVWTVRRSRDDATDAYIVVSFTNATLVLAVGDAVEEVSDSGFSGATRTLFAGALADGSLVQAHPGGLRHAGRAGGRGPVEWRAPGRRAVVAAASNGRQVALALAGGEVVAFELDGGAGAGGAGAGGGSLLEVDRKEIGADVGAVDIPPVPEGRLRSRFLAVGAYDGTVRVLSLDPGDGLKALAVQATGSPPESLSMLDASGGDAAAPAGPAAASSAAAADAADDSGLYLHAGLANGILLRVAVDRVTGQLSDARTRLLGTRAPKLVPLPLGGGGGGGGSPRAMLALSSRAWLAHTSGGRYALVPLSPPGDAPVDHAAPFASDACPDGSGGVCAVGGGDLRVLQLERASLEGAASGVGGFTATTARLRYTPRRLALLPEIGAVAVAESDHDVVSAAAEKEEGGGGGDEGDGGGVEFDDEAAAARERVGATRAAREEEGGGGDAASISSSAAWASALRVVDGRTLATRAVLELPAGEAVTSLCAVRFSGAPEYGAGKGSPPVLAVGTARRLRLSPEVSAEEGFIHLYRVVCGGSGDGGSAGAGGEGAAAAAAASEAAAASSSTTALELIHSTPVGGIPGALCAFRGKLLAGVGRTVRLYDAGRKKLLRKCEASGAPLPSRVVALSAVGGRVFAGDAQESVHLFRYRASDNALYPFADEALPRHVTCSAAMLPLDYDTAAVGDKFGTVAALRLPAAASAAAEADPTGGKFAFGGGAGAGSASGGTSAAAAAAMGAAGAPPVVGAPHKLTAEASFYVGDSVTSLLRGTLQAGAGGKVDGGADGGGAADAAAASAAAAARETLVYSTLSGSIGALLPLSSRDDVEFFSGLEARLRSDAPGATQLAGRDHASWRASFYPSRHVVDGDLCERFSSLPAAARAAIAKALDRTPLEVVRKLEDARNSVL